MRLKSNAPPPDPTATEERLILEQIAALKAKLPPREQEPRESVHAVVVKTFLDGACHSRSVDIGTEWGKVGHGIKEAIKQGGEVVMRPLYPGEVVQEQKYYPGRERIKELEAFTGRVCRLNRDAGEMGAGMLASLVDEARRLMGKGKP